MTLGFVAYRAWLDNVRLSWFIIWNAHRAVLSTIPCINLSGQNGLGQNRRCIAGFMQKVPWDDLGRHLPDPTYSGLWWRLLRLEWPATRSLFSRLCFRTFIFHPGSIFHKKHHSRERKAWQQTEYVNKTSLSQRPKCCKYGHKLEARNSSKRWDLKSHGNEEAFLND